MTAQRRSISKRVSEVASKRQQVREQLREMIFNGRYRPGTRLIQQELATQLGCSVSVMREVLLELAGVGLLRAEENVGFFVDRLDAAKLVDAWEVREVLEGLAARLCCQRASRQNVAELRELAECSYRLCCSSKESQVQEGVRLDRQLHERIVEIGGNEALQRAKRSFWLPMIAGDAVPQRRRKATYLEHKRLVAAIEQDRSDDAERLMREHLANAQRHILESVQTGKADLKWYV